MIKGWLKLLLQNNSCSIGPAGQNLRAALMWDLLLHCQLIVVVTKLLPQLNPRRNSYTAPTSSPLAWLTQQVQMAIFLFL